MKHLLTIATTLLLVTFATTALADRGDWRGDHGKYATKGERIERHLDRKGDRIEHRFEHKADRAERKGKYRKADRFRAKGERINRHLDRKGERIRARHDRHERRHRYDRYDRYDRRIGYHKAHEDPAQDGYQVNPVIHYLFHLEKLLALLGRNPVGFVLKVFLQSCIH